MKRPSIRGMLQGLLALLTFLTVVNPLRYPIYVEMVQTMHVDWFTVRRVLFWGVAGLIIIGVISLFTWACMEVMNGV